MEYTRTFDQTLIETENPADAKRILEEFGVCVVKNVLNEEECSAIVDGMVSSLEYLTADMKTPFKYDNQESWKGLDFLYPTSGLIFQDWKLGHAQFVWDVRTNPKVINTFATMWGSDDLLVSFDAISFALPPEFCPQNPKWQRKDRFHTDQSFLKKDFECIQGSINGLDTNEGDATLAVLVGSHKHHREYGQLNNITSPFDWHVYRNFSFFLEKGCVPHRITCARGSLVLWDSRTAHYGSLPLEGRAHPNTRALVYVCYTPKSKIREDTRKLKIQYFNKMKMTNHWPHQPHPFTESTNDVIRVLPRPKVDRKFLPLVGYNDGEY